VFAGSLDEPNGVSLMLDAFSRLRGGFRLRIAGRGPLEDKVRQAAANDSRIDYLGFLPHGQVLALYRSADLLVSARLTKGLNTRYFFPSKLMEYLASGVPVISTCTGHVEEEFGGFVYLLREETAESLAGLIAAIAASPRAERIEMGRRARGYMAAHKTWDSQSARVVTYLRESVLRLPSASRGARGTVPFSRRSGLATPNSPCRENWDSPPCGPPETI
jgi:glycosyltransferase involved in cell wall biosynthesis